MKRSIKFWALSIASLCFVVSLSQKIQHGRPALIVQYNKAVSVYNKATGTRNEAEESALNQQALRLFKDIASAFPRQPLYDSLLFYTQFFIGELEQYFENDAAALDHYAGAIAIHQQAGLPDSLLFRPYIFSGIIHYHRNEVDRASQLFYKAEDIQNKYAAPLMEGQRLFNTLGIINYETGNYRQAKICFQKALDLLKADNPYYTALLVNYKINLAQIHFKLEEFEDADRIYRQLIPLEQNTDAIYLNMGLISLNRGDAKTALILFRNIRDIKGKSVRLFHNIANAYVRLKRFDSARYYFNKSLLAASSEKDAIGEGLTLKSMGDLETATGAPARALTYYTAAMHQFYPGYTDIDVQKNPATFSGVFSYINLFTALKAKADALDNLYKSTGSVSHAEAALNSYRSSFALIEYVVRSYNSDEARLFVNKIKYAVHTRPIDIAYELYRKTGEKKFLEDLYFFDQQNKASVLALSQQDPEYRALQDSSLLSRERAIKTSITRLSLRASQLNDSALLTKLNSEIRDKEIALAALQKKMADKGTGGNQIPAIASVQKDLDASTALLSYHLSETKLTTFLITRDSFNCFQQIPDPGFHDDVRRYIANLRNGGDIAAIGKRLHAVLFRYPPDKKINRLLLIPDDELNYLAFESLQDRKGNYLAENYSIQYQYSTALFKKQVAPLRNRESLSMAPFSSRSLSDSSRLFDALPYSLKEIENLRGKKLTDTAATKAAFLNNLSKYQMIHLATHAIAGTGAGKSFIAFNDHLSAGENFLYTEEIYNLPLNHVALAILSACETGTGDLVKGEGVMSMSRAFTYAGCPNIITSLWKADDFSTAWLTKKLHDYLDDGLSIDKALQKAKRDYLADASINPRLKHPYYWSHLIFVGNYAPQSSSFAIFYIVVGLLAVLGLVFFLRKSRADRGN